MAHYHTFLINAYSEGLEWKIEAQLWPWWLYLDLIYKAFNIFSTWLQVKSSTYIKTIKPLLWGWKTPSKIIYTVVKLTVEPHYAAKEWCGSRASWQYRECSRNTAWMGHTNPHTFIHSNLSSGMNPGYWKCAAPTRPNRLLCLPCWITLAVTTKRNIKAYWQERWQHCEQINSNRQREIKCRVIFTHNTE